MYLLSSELIIVSKAVSINGYIEIILRLKIWGLGKKWFSTKEHAFRDGVSKLSKTNEEIKVDTQLAYPPRGGH